MKINTFEIENFRCVRSARFEFDPRLNIFIGANGAGKSTILSCLAILLSKLTARVLNPAANGRMITPDDISKGENFARCAIGLDYEGDSLRWTTARKKSAGAKPACSNQGDLKLLAEKIRFGLERGEPLSAPLAAFYPTNRHVSRIPLRIRKKHQFDQFHALENSLGNRTEETDFRLFFEWFRNQEDFENEQLRRQIERGVPPALCKRDRQLEAVRKAIGVLMPGFTGLSVTRKPRLRMVIEKAGIEFGIDELSDGEKCLLALVADMARRLALSNPGAKYPLSSRAVFLIDEIELHLHPEWQRRIVPGLLEAFPCSQFFITTHSPQVLGEIKNSDSIWILRPGQPPVHPRRAYGLTSSETLLELMDARDRSPEVSAEIGEIDEIIDAENYDLARKRIHRLAQKVGVIPAIIEANATLAMYGEEQAELDNIGND